MHRTKGTWDPAVHFLRGSARNPIRRWAISDIKRSNRTAREDDATLAAKPTNPPGSALSNYPHVKNQLRDDP